MDRFTLGVVIGVLTLAVGTLAVVTLNRANEPVPDLTTPDGTVRAYIAAVRDRRAGDAWRLLESPQAVEGTEPSRRNGKTEADFQRDVNSMHRPSSRRIRIVDVSGNADRSTVEIEVLTSSDAPFLFDGGSRAHRVAFSLRQYGAEWRITAAPSLWEIG
jgi:hypothetical protein